MSIDLATVVTGLTALSTLLLAWYQFFYKRRSERRESVSRAELSGSGAIESLSKSIKNIDELRDRVLQDIRAEADNLRARLVVVETQARMDKTTLNTTIVQLRNEITDCMNTATTMTERAIRADTLAVELNEAHRQINIYQMRLDTCRNRVEELERELNRGEGIVK